MNPSQEAYSTLLEKSQNLDAADSNFREYLTRNDYSSGLVSNPGLLQAVVLEASARYSNRMIASQNNPQNPAYNQHEEVINQGSEIEALKRINLGASAKSFLRFGGAVIAVLGTSSLVFWELASKKRRAKPKLLLAASRNFVPNTIPVVNNFQGISSVQDNQEPLANTKIPHQIQQPSVSPEAKNFPPQEVPNFYQTGDIGASISNDYDAANGFNPHSSSEEKYAEVKSLIYENTVGIVGKEKGSGKTSKLGYLIAEHIKLGHLVWMVNPFAFMSTVERY